MADGSIEISSINSMIMRISVSKHSDQKSRNGLHLMSRNHLDGLATVWAFMLQEDVVLI